MVTRRAVGTVVLVLGWSAVAAAGVLIGLGATGRASSRDEVVGSGLALLMAGMLVVVLGNYVHHQTGDEDDEVRVDQDR